MTFKRPRPRPPKAKPASSSLSPDARRALAAAANYVGSPHHTDIPKYGLQPAPREGATTIEDADARGLKNPSCTLCPRKWAGNQAGATRLLRSAIENGHFIAAEDGAPPARVWARDPDDPSMVYEAKRLSSSPAGYKAYPLTAFQAQFSLPFDLP